MSKPTSVSPIPRRGHLAPANGAEFVKSLSATQRAYFRRRESERQARLQAALRDLARGLGVVNALNGHAVNALAHTAP
ncbi:MAG: hypothetical protein EPN38_11395 [Rhodanobacteraceae bacterium]|nr:MAG: hypothetical protein EPN38_11395 [Rhodanobacteraceae bacterium]